MNMESEGKETGGHFTAGLSASKLAWHTATCMLLLKTLNYAADYRDLPLKYNFVFLLWAVGLFKMKLN